MVATQSSELENLEKRVAELESKFGKGKPPNDKKPREPSEYNKFMSTFIETEKKKDSSKTHKELFSEAAKAWTLQKDKK